MAKYRPVHVRIWSNPDFEDYSPHAKLIALFLFTNPFCTESGIYEITFKKISDFTGLTRDEVKNAMEKYILGDPENLENDSFAFYDYEKKEILVLNFLKHNGKGRKDLIAASVKSDISRASPTLAKRFYNTYRSLFKDFSSISCKSDSFYKDMSKNNNIKTSKKKNNNITKSNILKLIVNKRSDDFVDAFKKFFSMRKKIGKPLDVSQAKLILDKLDDISAVSNTLVKILNNSTINEWPDVYPLKVQDNSNAVESRLKPFLSKDQINNIAKFCPDISLNYVNSKIELMHKRRPKDKTKFLYQALKMNYETDEHSNVFSEIMQKAKLKYISKTEFDKLPEDLQKTLISQEVPLKDKFVYLLKSKPEKFKSKVDEFIFKNLDIGDEISEKSFNQTSNDNRKYFEKKLVTGKTKIVYKAIN